MRHRLIPLIAAVTISVFASDGATAESQAVPSPNLSLELTVDMNDVTVGNWAQFSVYLVNEGEVATTVLLPGDGSDVGWRTPVVRWSPPMKHGDRCAYMNELKPEDIVTLAPGERVQLEWVRYYHSTKPGTHTVTLELEHIPDLPWGGPFGAQLHDSALMLQVRQLPPYKVVSNPVEITVLEPPAPVE